MANLFTMLQARSRKRTRNSAAAARRSINWKKLRVKLVGGGLLVATAIALGQIGHLNLARQDFLTSQGNARTVRDETITAHRGMILDRHGEPIAISTPVDSVWVDPSQIAKGEGKHLLLPEFAPQFNRLCELLGLNAKELRNSLTNDSKREFRYLKRRLATDLSRQIKAMALPGVYFQREYRRYYPAGEIVSHLTGMTNSDDRGIEGIELSFDEVLRGRPGAKRVLKDRDGRVVNDLEFVRAAQSGQDITLSLDLRLQYMAYRELKRAVTEVGATSGSVVMIDAKSAEVLALVNQPSFNPNRRGAPADLITARRNRAVVDLFEPGSTLKPFTMLAALEMGTVELDSVVDTNPGWINVSGKRIEDPRNKGVLSLGQILAQSSQVGITKIALDLPEAALPSVLRRVGIAQPVDIGLPGEVSGVIPRGVSHPLVRSTLAFGYGVQVSPLQLARAYGVLASGGVVRPLSIVRRDEIPAGERVIDARVAAQVARLLEGVVGPGGTAPKAKVPGYRIAGKTGTARKVAAGGGYDRSRHVAFFAGFAPATDPRIVVVVVVNEPSGVRVGGGDVAAPVFGRIAATALRLLEVPPDGELEEWGGTV